LSVCNMQMTPSSSYPMTLEQHAILNGNDLF
jgi:hypothetical protein